MGDIRTVITDLLRYYSKTKGVGHTQASLEGVVHTPGALLVVPVYGDREHISKRWKEHRLLSLQNLEPMMYTQRAPLVWDNHAIVYLLREVLKNFQRYDQGEQMLRYRILNQRNTIRRLQESLDKLGIIIGDTEGKKDLKSLSTHMGRRVTVHREVIITKRRATPRLSIKERTFTGWVVGFRTIQEGYTVVTEDGCYFRQRGHMEVALVAEGPRRKPRYVPIEDIIGIQKPNTKDV